MPGTSRRSAAAAENPKTIAHILARASGAVLRHAPVLPGGADPRVPAGAALPQRGRRVDDRVHVRLGRARGHLQRDVAHRLPSQGLLFRVIFPLKASRWAKILQNRFPALTMVKDLALTNCLL